MSLSFVGPGGSVERRWIVYALLSDNVQFHLEGGVPSPAFAELHALGDAMTKGEVVVDAVALRRQVEAARSLLERPIADLAVTLRTRAASMLRFPVPSGPQASLVSDTEWSVPFPIEGAGTLGDVFGSLVDELLKVTDGARDGDQVTVVDG